MMPARDWPSLRQQAWFCVVAAFFGVMGDLCLLAYAGAGTGAVAPVWLDLALDAGARIGVAAVLTHAPLAGLIVAQAMPLSMPAQACFWLGLANGVVAAMAHTGMASTLALCHATGLKGILSNCTLAHPETPTRWLLLLVISLLAVSGCFVLALVRSAPALPPWLKFANPASLTLVIAALAPPFGKQADAMIFLAPSLACVAFYVLLLWMLPQLDAGPG